MVLFLAAMQNILPDLYDAARIDSTNRWQEFRSAPLRLCVSFLVLCKRMQN
jgi:ABC-type sugar transport system permease subunit